MIDSPLIPLDLASGMVVGLDPAVAPMRPGPSSDARLALRECVAQALCRPPCVVSFSGGRDSSALLALALDVSRKEGLDPPLPATLSFPGASESEESQWQEELIAQLGVRDWWRLSVGTELELLGGVATTSLRRRGLRYPPNLHFHIPILEQARGGSLLSGIGGDELLTPTVGARTSLLRAGQVRPRGRDLLNMALWAAPAWMRGRWLGLRSGPAPSWMRPVGRRLLHRGVVRWLAAQPLDFDSYLRDWWWRTRYFQHGRASLAMLAEDHDVRPVFPFMDRHVLDGIAGARGSEGFVSRAAAMEWLFADVLPERVIKRPTKAAFDSVLIGPETKAFMHQWDGCRGIDPGLVDAEVLRAQWLSGDFDVRSMVLLQSAWLAS